MQINSLVDAACQRGSGVCHLLLSPFIVGLRVQPTDKSPIHSKLVHQQIIKLKRTFLSPICAFQISVKPHFYNDLGLTELILGAFLNCINCENQSEAIGNLSTLSMLCLRTAFDRSVQCQKLYQKTPSTYANGLVTLSINISYRRPLQK